LSEISSKGTRPSDGAVDFDHRIRDNTVLMRRSLYTVALISAVQLGLELQFIKLARYDFSTFSILAIGIAILGIGAAGFVVERQRTRHRSAYALSLLLLPCLAFVAGVVFFSSPHSLQNIHSVFIRMGLESLLAFLVMACSAVPIFIVMEHHAERASLVYGASLLGAAAGAVLSFALCHLGGDIAAYCGVVFLLSLVATPSGFRPSRAARIASVVLPIAGLFAFPALERVSHRDSVYSSSNSFTRIDVVEGYGSARIKTGGVNAGTSIITEGYKPMQARYTRHLSAVPFYVGAGDALILGSGGGKNVGQALNAGVKHVTAIEINDLIVDYMADHLDPVINPYADPRTDLIVGEGRAAVAGLIKKGTKYDLVYVPLATLYGSSGHVFTHTYLMTRDALCSYLELLDDEGILAVYYIGGSLLRAKIAFTFYSALRACAPEADWGQMGVFVFNKKKGIAPFTILARKGAPLQSSEIDNILARVPKVRALDAKTEVERGARLIAVTDDNPFLHNDTEIPEANRRFFVWSHQMLKPLLIGMSLFCAALCLWGGSRRKPACGISYVPAMAHLLAFTGIGFAYTLQQTLALQKLEFFLEHPMTNTFVVIPCSLLGTGLGSISTSKFPKLFSGARLFGVRLLLPVMILALAAVPSTTLLSYALPLPARIGMVALLVIPCFFIMGTYFPVFFSRVARLDASQLAWCWASNATSAVVGSLFFVVVGMQVGFRTLAIVPAVVYLALTWWDWNAGRASSRHLHISGSIGTK
jgi:spermidine synthase